MKHVCLFSGGAASSVVAFLVKEKVLREGGSLADIVLLHTPSLSELPDSEKFRLKCSKYIGIPITTWGTGMDIWDVIEKEKTLPSSFAGFCTRELKVECKETYYKYLESIGETWIEYLGFTVDEERRVNRSIEKAKEKGREVRFPVFDAGYTSEDCKRIITQDWNIPLPDSYKYFGHNNCIPCFKAGKSSFKLVWEHFPEQFFKAAECEKKVGYTVFKDASLYEFAEKWALEKIIKGSQGGLLGDIEAHKGA